MLTPLRYTFLTTALDVGQRTVAPPGPFTPTHQTTVPIKEEGGWAPEPMWAFSRKEMFFTSAGIGTPDLQARSWITMTIKQSWFPESLECTEMDLDLVFLV